jgi:beta-lactam-binding protein with PASTA domain
MTRAPATATILRSKLAVGRVTGRVLGKVVSQSPAAGASVPEGSSVDLVMARERPEPPVQPAPPGGVTVPNVVGLGRGQATATLHRVKLRVGRVTGPSSGNVASQSPAAGASVPEGSSVDLVMAPAGAEPPVRPAPPGDVTVPNVVGLGRGQATTALARLELRVGNVTGPSSGKVRSQSPAAGSVVPERSQVNLIMERSGDDDDTGGRGARPEETTVPNVVGMRRGPATAAIRGARLSVGTVTGPSSGRVRSQSPAAGTSVPVGSAVAIELKR